MLPLTKRQREILDFLNELLGQKHRVVGPSCRGQRRRRCKGGGIVGPGMRYRFTSQITTADIRVGKDRQ